MTGSSSRALLLPLCALAGVLSPLARADEPVPDAELPPVTAEGRAEPEPGSVERDPSAFATVVRARPGERASAAQLAQEAPGVAIRDFGLNQSATLSIRGSTSDQVLVLLDGLPLNPAAGGGADLSTLPAPFIERVGVVRGAVGARFGPGALGGAVLIDSHRPKPGERRIAVDLAYGSFETVEGTAAGTASLSPSTAGLAALTLMRSRGDFTFGYDDRPQIEGNPVDVRRRTNNDARRAAALVRLTTDRAGWEGDLVVQGGVGERGLPGTIQAPTPDQRQFDSRLAAAGRLGVRLDSGEIGVRLGTRVDRLRIGPASAPEPAPAQDGLFGFAALGLRKLVGRHALTAEAGAGAERLVSPAHGRPSRALFAADLADEISWGGLSVVPALRADRVGDASALSPKLGLAIPLWDAVTLKANAGQSFRPPSFGELYLDQGVLSPNPELVPERAAYGDVGLDTRLGPLAATLSAYDTLYDDLILYELYAPMRAKPFNLGRAEVYGTEVELSAARSPVSVAMSWTLAFSTNGSRDVRYAGMELPYHPRHRLRGRLGLELGRLTAHAVVGVQSGEFVNRTNIDRAPARARLDAGASFVVDRARGLLVALKLTNVLGSDDRDLYGYPLPGRALMASLRLDLPLGEKSGPPLPRLADANPPPRDPWSTP